MTLYIYKTTIKTGNSNVEAICGIKENKITKCLEKFAYILEWFSVGFLFYLNSTFIHSKLFSIFIFIVGLILMSTLSIKRELSSKEEFLQKVNEILKDED